jgi:hypothetical protein
VGTVEEYLAYRRLSAVALGAAGHEGSTVVGRNPPPESTPSTSWVAPTSPANCRNDLQADQGARHTDSRRRCRGARSRIEPGRTRATKLVNAVQVLGPRRLAQVEKPHSAPVGGMGGVEATGGTPGSREVLVGGVGPESMGLAGVAVVGSVPMDVVSVDAPAPATGTVEVPPLVGAVGAVPTGAVVATPGAGRVPRRGKDGRRRRRRSE